MFGQGGVLDPSSSNGVFPRIFSDICGLYVSLTAPSRGIIEAWCESEMISGAQLRAARGLLDWSQPQLAYAAGLSISTVKRAERDLGAGLSSNAYCKIESALMRAGIVFLMHDRGGGPGVRLRNQSV